MVAAIQMSGQSLRYTFADLTLDVGQRRVIRNGQALHLGKLTYDLLVALVEAAPNVVTQEEFAARVWSGRMATPETVAQRVKLLRLALDDHPTRPRYIEVRRGQGYRLIPPVERASDPATSDPSPAIEVSPVETQSSWRPTRWFVAGSLVAAVCVGAIIAYVRNQAESSPPAASTPSAQVAPKSIAVLPFTDMSEGQNQQYIADGIAEEILDRLAQNTGALRVIARTSSFSFRDRQLEIPEIATQLDVSHVLEGSVRRSGERIRITVQLVEGAGATHVWSRTYDHELGDLFAIQDEIASSVASALKVTLDGGESRARGPHSTAAYEHFLRGQELYNRRGPGDIRLATQMYEEAVALDPGFARAWAALSGAYNMLVLDGEIALATGRKLQGDAAHRAVELDPKLAVAHDRLARYYFNVDDEIKAREHARIARELDPQDPLVLGGQAGAATWREDHETALEFYRRVVDNDPLSALARLNLAAGLVATARFDEAIKEYRAIRNLNPALANDCDLRIAQLLVLERRLDEAESIVDRIPPGNLRDQALALLHRHPARGQAADAALARLVDGDAAQPSVAVAEIYAYRGMQPQSLAALESAHRRLQESPNFAPGPTWRFQIELRTSPFFASLRAQPRFRALVNKSEDQD
jgi:TolB-like protein/DNA-binding winged helix-turn-helix (wHTH) protein/tetratricopeptide (TPR) repeat protein